jgi:outer membrane protein OmpA-like peptidoglycan-associated protein
VKKKLLKYIGGAFVGIIIASSSFAGNDNSIVKQTDLKERYVPAIWVDPDGCEHWAMDDGVEGYMTPHVTRDGIPVCNRGNPCAVINSDQLFAVDQWRLNASNRTRLKKFFKTAGATTYIIDGHTDSDASDAYNMRLSKRRAQSVAKVAQSAGATAQARWYGERVPLASNKTRAGKAKNRRVEITCIR